MRSLRRLGVLFAIMMVLGACGGGDDGGNAADTGADDEEAAPAPGSLDLTASGFAFTPGSLEATGTEFTINLSNNDEVGHNLTIEDLDVDEDAKVGESVEVSVTGAAPGTYEYFCAIHPDTMRGELTVSS
jgi:plastocyanin